MGASRILMPCVCLFLCPRPAVPARELSKVAGLLYSKRRRGDLVEEEELVPSHPHPIPNSTFHTLKHSTHKQQKTLYLVISIDSYYYFIRYFLLFVRMLNEYAPFHRGTHSP